MCYKACGTESGFATFTELNMKRIKTGFVSVKQRTGMTFEQYRDSLATFPRFVPDNRPPVPPKAAKHSRPMIEEQKIGEALDRFWATSKNKPDRLHALKQAAEVVISRPIHGQRMKFSRLRVIAKFFADPLNQWCFVCEYEAEARHHVVQLKHGGDNRELNIVPLCETCHALIHPWIAEE